jgi:hypothetical protein
MRAEEQKIIKTYLQEAYINLQEVQEREKISCSERFPAVSKDLTCAKAVFDTLCNLARNLGISNPYERLDYEILCVED